MTAADRKIAKSNAADSAAGAAAERQAAGHGEAAADRNATADHTAASRDADSATGAAADRQPAADRSAADRNATAAGRDAVSPSAADSATGAAAERQAAADHTAARRHAVSPSAAADFTAADRSPITSSAADRNTVTRNAFTRSGMTLREAASLFVRHPNSRVLAATTATAAVSRVLLGRWGKRDAVAAVAILGAEPFVEWLIHVHVLHRLPREKPDGTVADSLLASSHRAHHSDPRDPDLVFIPRPAVAPSIAALALANLAGARAVRPALTGFATAVASMTAYEWTHFLIHSAYRPQSKIYKTIRRTHQLHHFRNENYWFGIITPVSDKVLHTYPRKEDVAVSSTAKALGGTR